MKLQLFSRQCDKLNSAATPSHLGCDKSPVVGGRTKCEKEGPFPPRNGNAL